MKRSYLLLKNISIRKIANSLKLRFSYLLSIITGVIKPWGLPEALAFETSAVCNLHCPECPVGVGSLVRDNNFSDFEDFKKVIDELHPYLWHLFLYFQGEPFMNKNIFDYVSYAHSKNIYTAVSTNGHFITKEVAEKMIHSGLDEVIISLDGMTQASYEKYRKGGDWQRVVEGIEILRDVKKEKKSKTPMMTIQFIVFSHNESEVPLFLSKKQDWGADYMELKTAQIYDLNNVSLLPKNDKYRRYVIRNGKAQIKKKQRNRCWRMWHSTVITSDGEVVPCCFDKNGEYVMGSIARGGEFADVWNSVKYKEFRQVVFSDRKSVPMCNNCSE